MRIRLGLLVAASFVVSVVVACGSSDGTTGGAAGAACVGGQSCQTGLYCLVAGPEPSGVCTAPPAACSAKIECGGACGDELKSACGGTTTRCQGVVGRYTLGCGTPAPRTDGQTCSQVVGCGKGLYCDIKSVDALGACVKLPEACATSPTCDCLKPIYEACSEGHQCSVLGDTATVACL